MIFLILTLLQILQVALVESQLLFLGQCPVIEGMKGLDCSKLNAVFIEHSKYFAKDRLDLECTGLDFISNSESTSITAYFTTLATDFTQTTLGYAICDADGNIELQFDSNKGIIGKYQVLDTDYQTYLIIYNCEPADIYKGHYKKLFVYFNVSTPTVPQILNVWKIINSKKLVSGFLLKTFQFNCPGYNVIID